MAHTLSPVYTNYRIFQLLQGIWQEISLEFNYYCMLKLPHIDFPCQPKMEAKDIIMTMENTAGISTKNQTMRPLVGHPGQE